MIKRICQCCGKEIYATPSEIKRGKKYCSVECQHKMQQTGRTINCQNCGKLFYTNRDNKYCSQECYYKGREYLKRENNPQYKRETRICKKCGKEIKVKPSDKKIFCSSKCSQEWHKGNNNGQYINRIKRKCPICKKLFYTLPTSKRVHCSRECYRVSCLGRISWNKTNLTKKCIICGKAYRVVPSRYENSKYCSNKCFHESKRRITGEKHPLYKKINIRCKWCGKLYKIKPSQIGKLNFCSRRCVGCYSVSHQNNPSNIEKKLSNYLIESKISFICQFKYELGVADFFIKPSLVVEVDGNYWHNLPEVKERDKRQTLFLEGEGYKVLRLWENEINKNPDKCINRILEYI